MTKPSICLIIACALLAAAPAIAQTTRGQAPEVQAEAKTLAGLFDAVSQAPKGSQASNYEEIEIFRRILETALLRKSAGRLAQFHSYGLAFSPDGRFLAGAEGQLGPVRLWDVHSGQDLSTWLAHDGLWAGQGSEGLYLPGYGYVFTVTMPVDGRRSVTGPARSGPKPPSQWEQVRNELRGVKVKPEEVKGAPQEPAMADVVLKLLADNGRHFSLPENQHVTVAITLRSVGACMQCHTAGTVQTGSSSSAVEAGPRPGGAVDHSASTASEALLSEALARIEIGKVPGAKDADAKKAEASNMTHLGDIRLRQGRAQEAIDAYHKAIDLYEKLPDWKHRVTRMDKEGKQYLADVAEAHTKIAQAYLMRGESDKAMATLKQAQTYWNRAAGGGSFSGTFSVAAEPASAALPEKLIISASKQMLDEVANGKLSFEDFKKKATVEHVTFPAAGKAPSKP